MKARYIFVVLLVGLTSCRTSKHSVEQPYSNPLLLDKMWAVTSIKGKEVQYPNQGDVSYFVFSGDRKVKGGGGCNQYSGKFRAVGDSISFSDVVSTRKACPELKIEEAFFQAIPEVVRFKVGKENLKFYDIDKREVMNCIYLDEKDMKE